MSAEIIQFVPRPNPHREGIMSPEMAERAKEMFVAMKPGCNEYKPDYSPSDYTAPTDDCA